jgi:hypothetical protein
MLIGLALVLATTGPALAQTPTETPEIERSVAPEACVVTPRSLNELQEIVDRPAPDGTDIRVDVRYAPGDGQRAGDVAASQVTLVLYQLAACFNANDLLRVYALFSDSGLRPALFPEDIEAAATVTPVALDEANQFAEPVVWDVRVQRDGRVTALVDFDGEIAIVTFVWDDELDRYLIDLFDDQIPQDLTPVVEED